MNPTALVIKHEIITKLTQRSFLFVTFGLPALGFILFAIAAAINSNSPDLIAEITTGPDTVESEGYVDESGLIDFLPESVPEDTLIAYADEAAAQQALDAGEITAFYIVSADFIESGRVTYVRPGVALLSNVKQRKWIEWTLTVNLLDGDADLAARVERPFILHETSLGAEPPRDETNPLTLLLPYGIALVLCSLIFGMASESFESMTAERENRVIEILMTSISPQQVFVGKMIGLGTVGLLMGVLWIGSSYALVQLGGETTGRPPEFQLPASIVTWGILFFLLGYALYGSLTTGIGALVSNLRVASQVVFVVSLPLFVSLLLVGVLVQDPNGPTAIGLSLFPFTAPVAMMMRMSISNQVPGWQILLAAALLLLSTVFIIRTVTRLFRVQALLVGQPFHLRRFFGLLFGRG